MRRTISGHRAGPSLPPNPWERLAVAILLRAGRDSRTDPEAAAWLRGPGDELAHLLGWPAGTLRDFDPERVDWRVLSTRGCG